MKKTTQPHETKEKKYPYETSNDATEELWKIIRHLDALALMERPEGKIDFGRAHEDVNFGYERQWDEGGEYIGDFLTAYYYKKGDIYITTMTPDKFEAMSNEGKADFLNFLINKANA